MIVDDLQRSIADGRCEISARVRRGQDEELRLWYRFPEELAPERLDGSPFLAGVLVWAMRARESVTVDAPVSPRLLASLDEIFAMYRSFFPMEMRAVDVQAPAGEPPPPSPVTGSFFTRGVDSWFGVLTALEDDPQDPPLTHLVFCPDFLPDSWDDEMVEFKTRGVRQTVAETPCELVMVQTNQKRDFRGHQLVAMALAMGFERMLIPSAGMRGELRPRATHPELDPRFSSERTEIVHYGDASRMQKVARLARSRHALRTVNVCRYNSSTSDINCGRCEKCVRTMIQLHVLGALDGPAAGLFLAPLEPHTVAVMSKEMKNPHRWVELLAELGDSELDRRLAAAVRVVVARADLRNAYERLDSYAGDPELATVRPDMPDALQRTHGAVRQIHRDLHPDAPPRTLRERLTLLPSLLRILRTR